MHITFKGAMKHYNYIKDSGGMAIIYPTWYGWHVSEFISHF